LLTPEALSFIIEHENSDVQKLILKHKVLFGFPVGVIADQIIGRRKAKDKLPSYYSNRNVHYPPALNIEQSSSEKTARYKADLIKNVLGAPLSQGADLTGGFGVDCLFLSQLFSHFDHVEPNKGLSEIARHNHHQLGSNNISYHQTTAETFLKNSSRKFDLFFIDPSRRTAANKKALTFKDCEPDVTHLLNDLLAKADNVLIKASPLIDIQQGISELRVTTKVVVLSVNNECKEVLFLLQANGEHEPEIDAVNIQHDHQQVFRFNFIDEKSAVSHFSRPLQYLYEPNASVLKAGAFKSIASSFAISKLHPSTHLYTSDNLVDNFPGRTFKIIEIVKADAKIMKVLLPDRKANVTTRNYPLTTEELKKKLQLTDGGDKYVIGFSGMDKKYLVLAERIF
jgi:hypothetical protein